MIRTATSEDQAKLLAIAAATGLFTPPELDGFGEMIGEHLDSEGAGDHYWIADNEDGLVGAAYYAPETFAEGVWNLYFIGILPSEPGKGRGTVLIRHVEADLRARGERLLLVETSSLESFEQTRRFYHKNGYHQEARIRDYYNAGEDKIIFRKVLSTPGQ